MHREVMGLEPGDPRQIDHLNHNVLDNRRRNLRITDARGNNENRRNQSPYGVGVIEQCGKFRVIVRHGGRQIGLGTFDTPEEAQDARRQFLEDPEKYEKPPDPRPSPWGTGVRQVNTGRFEANVSRKGRWHYLGMFATAAEAREARRKFLENNP